MLVKLPPFLVRFFVCLWVVSLGAFSHAAESNPYLGRWNIHIENTGDTFSTSWLKVESTDGRLGGALVWKWGSVVPIQDVVVDDQGLRFQSGKESYQAKLVDGQLRGEAVLGDERFVFTGRPALEMCNVAGAWKTWPADDPTSGTGTLELSQQGDVVAGKAYDPEGNTYAVENGRLDGRNLVFQAKAIGFDVAPREVHCEIRGDALVGYVELPADGDNEARKVAIQGQRQREWGAPVVLLRENSLDGWGPRDPSKKFGWKVVDGVLENQPPDVDIMSAAKFGDFKLHLEYKVDPGSNSGVYLRGRYELQILGSTRVEDHGNMAVYSRLKPQRNPLKPGEWNSLDVTFIGRWVTVVLNGVTVHDNEYLEGPTGGAWDPAEEEPGPLLLQGDHGKVAYRNIVVTPAE